MQRHGILPQKWTLSWASLVRALGSAETRSSPQHVANRISVHRLRRLTQPVERRAAAVVELIGVGAVFEQDLDRLHKSGLHYVVQRVAPW
jgi:hypothetical protein